VSVIAASAAIIAAVVALLGAREARQTTRVQDLEKGLDGAHEQILAARADREQIWLYCRQLIHHIYVGNPPPPPPPPPGIFD